jgi:hypothetical protein
MMGTDYNYAAYPGMAFSYTDHCNSSQRARPASFREPPIINHRIPKFLG